ncbi:hypothetical protein QBZ16_000880 [Prototheca wickerhamii]|uniref:Deoxyribodipyrimidine photo-lyase n=1 Tax=Prototheca wickerhamii TaxID=3111 RepID=A0AAD9IGT6_PROWI|nr:hypothetical protein QBZ16_000880 [Prototheca wickerhamii]
MNAGARQWCFLVKGLREVEATLKEMGIPFFLLFGKPGETIPKLVKELDASALVTDFIPLRVGRQWKDEVAKGISIPFDEVDAHNIIPPWVVSDKKEVGARTIRRKVHQHLPDFLVDIPQVQKQEIAWTWKTPDENDWEAILKDVRSRGKDVPEVSWCKPGEQAGWEALQAFLKDTRPQALHAVSNLSPYIHFGQLSCQRIVLEAKKRESKFRDSIKSFVEELVVRRELAENYVFYEPNYDNEKGAANWAVESLNKHLKDKREFTYTREEWEKGKTHDKLWNAAQLEMVYSGKLHGFMRMYWAKKILEWSKSPKEALDLSLYLNDKYELDGRDPNGVVGCMWSIYGIHDQGWAERDVFGKIRYMNANGCRRKFDVDKYIARVDKLVADTKKPGNKLGATPVHVKKEEDGSA